jgi:hypothetical protein
MNIVEAFASYLTTITGTILGQDIFIGNAPSDNKLADPFANLWWIVASGGSRDTDAVTGEAIKSYSIEIYLRSRDYKAVYDELHTLEENLNCDGCVQLEGFETVDVKAQILSIDDDLDNVERKVGLLQAEILTYKGDC